MHQRSDELAAVMKRLMVAIQTGDSATARGLVSPESDTLLIGVREENWLYGREAYEVLAAQLSVAEQYERTFHRIEAYEEGPIGWAAVESTITLPDGLTAVIRTTAVFRLESGVWRVVQWHASNPSKLDTEWGRDLPLRLSDLIGSLDSEALDLAGSFDTATLTFLVTDIEASTDLTLRLGDGLWSDEVTRHFEELRRIARAQDGRVVKTMGDGALIALPTALGAVRAALEIQRSVEKERPFVVRIGVHSGEAVHVDDDYLGFCVNKAARIAAAAAGGQTLISEVVRAALDDQIDVGIGDAFALSLKGMPGTHTVHSLTVG